MQIAWIIADSDGKPIREASHIVRPPWWRPIPSGAVAIHGITTSYARKHGKPLVDVLRAFIADTSVADTIVCHNAAFDTGVLMAEMQRSGINFNLSRCTMEESTDFCQLHWYDGAPKYKWPKLTELHEILFGESFNEAHDAMADDRATMRCFFALEGMTPEEKTGPSNAQSNDLQIFVDPYKFFKERKLVAYCKLGEVTLELKEDHTRSGKHIFRIHLKASYGRKARSKGALYCNSLDELSYSCFTGERALKDMITDALINSLATFYYEMAPRHSSDAQTCREMENSCNLQVARSLVRAH